MHGNAGLTISLFSYFFFLLRKVLALSLEDDFSDYRLLREVSISAGAM
jgi:hypothetical protein